MAQFNRFEEVIDFSFWREICEKQGERVHYSRGDYFVHAGSVLQHVGWIVSGGFKHTLIDNAGNVKAVGFVFEGTVLANYLSGVIGHVMPTSIVALEDSEVLVVAAEIIREHFLNTPELNLRFVLALFGQAYEHILNDYRYTPYE
ncbi:MAG: cyclic nucleotide-binding domain-containing protein, partial [Muribaculaceae bacterium]|nr:cyclic nucleotide-binding domain-containing protein [Muribaculaceae bacterium]